MVGIERTASADRGLRRRSEPVHIHEVVAEIWAALKTGLNEAREDPNAQPNGAMCAARPGH
jgi:hypothetical protein